MTGRWTAGGLAVAVIVAFLLLDLGAYVRVDVVRDLVASLRGVYAEHAVAVLAAYFVAYVALAALCLPGATAMSLTGGAVFGFWTGVVVVSFASSLGATLGFLLSRYLFRDAVQRRFGVRLDTINTGIRRDGAWYLLSVRLIPGFPFFLVNLLSGLTPLPVGTFYVVSQVGMLGGTMTVVNAGTELAKIESATDILSPSVFFAFFLIGVLPLVARLVLRFLRPTTPRV